MIVPSQNRMIDLLRGMSRKQEFYLYLDDNSFYKIWCPQRHDIAHANVDVRKKLAKGASNLNE